MHIVISDNYYSNIICLFFFFNQGEKEIINIFLFNK